MLGGSRHGSSCLWLYLCLAALASPALAETSARAGCPATNALLSVEKMPGLHVVCASAGRGDALKLCIFADGLRAESCSHTLELTRQTTVTETIKALVNTLGRRSLWPKSPIPGLFSGSGRKFPLDKTLKDVGLLEYRNVVVLIEGGVWHWPPVEIGFERPLKALVKGGPSIVLRTVSLVPRVFEVKSFIEDVEAVRILEKAGPHIEKSTVWVMDQDIGRPVDDWRTSETYFLPSTGDPVLQTLDERVQYLTRIPIDHCEHAQILKYSYRGRYTPHMDAFDPAFYQKDPDTLELIGGGAYNRVLTVFMYLSDVEEGGETWFPRHNGRQDYDQDSCSGGLAMKPERLKVIVFYNMYPDGKLDPHSVHGGCRVWNGTKWSANFWVWNVPRPYKTSNEAKSMAKEFSQWAVARDKREELNLGEVTSTGKAEL